MFSIRNFLAYSHLSKVNLTLLTEKMGRENQNVLQQFIIDPYIRKLKSCALKYRCVGEENFYLKRLGARQSRLISVLTFGNAGSAVGQSCWLTSRRATRRAKWRSSFYHLKYVRNGCPPIGNGDIVLPHTSLYGTLTHTKGSGHLGYGDFIIHKILQLLLWNLEPRTPYRSRLVCYYRGGIMPIPLYLRQHSSHSREWDSNCIKHLHVVSKSNQMARNLFQSEQNIISHIFTNCVLLKSSCKVE